jgi:hypothetical protein
VPWTTEQARRRISQLGPMLATAHSPRVRRVIVTSPAAGIVEMTIVVAMGAQVRADAVRLERPARSSGTRRPAGQAGAGPDRSRGPAGGGWLCTAVEAA